MSDREKSEKKGADLSDMESETRRLMKEAMSKISPDGTSESIDAVEETTGKIDDSFQRMQTIIDELLSAIGKAINSIEPSLKAKRIEVISSISEQLATAGLGMFGTRAVKITEDELESNFSVEGLFSSVLEAIERTRITVAEVMVNMRKVAAHNVGQSTSGLQKSLLQMYAKLTEAEKQLETTRAEVRKWRGKSNEIEERLRQREDVMATSSEEMLRMHSSIKELNTQLEERDMTISSLKGELSQARSHAEQQVELMAALDSAEQLATKYDEKILELSRVQGQLAELTENLSQRETEISILKSEIEKLQEDKVSADSQVRSMVDELASLKGSERDVAAEIDEMSREVDELKARWETLYRVAEDDSTFKAYFLIADKTQWFEISHLSSALGTPTVQLKRNLQKFVDVGLLEIDGDKVRPRSLSELASNVKESEVQMLEDARAESDDTDSQLISLPEYTGPEDGKDYEQEGR
jgi:chromosome segregation ATPase